MTNLQYVRLLNYLDDMTTTLAVAEFDSRQVSDFIISRIAIDVMTINATITNAVNIKRVSNDLNRLYHMRLLRRRRIKRICEVKNILGHNKITCPKGFMYKYSFTKQGLSYSKYLKKKDSIIDPIGLKRAITQENDLVKDAEFRTLVDHVKEKAPSLGLAAWKATLYFAGSAGIDIKFKGRYRRFPPKVDRLVMALVNKLMVESRARYEEIQRLQQEIQSIEEERKKERGWYMDQIRQLANDLQRR